MVEGIHAVLVDAGESRSPGVPALPDGGRPLGDRVEPGGILGAGNHPEGFFAAAGPAQGGQDVRGGGKTGGDGV